MPLKPVNYNNKLNESLEENPEYKSYVKYIQFIRKIKCSRGKDVIKKVSSILMIIFTLGCLYFMSQGLVGIPLSYVLIIIHLARLIVEISAARIIADKLTIREDIRTEIPRKVTHLLLGLVTAPMLYYSFKGTIHSIICPVLILVLISVLDKIGFARKIATRDGEGDDNVASVYYYIIGFLINSLISLIISQYTMGVLLGTLTLGLGDPSACIIGKLFGKHKFKNGKSIEGFVAFIIGATISMYLFTHLAIWKLLLISIFGAIAELYSGERDNIIIQLVVSLVTFIIL